MKILFKNTTKYDKENRDNFINFHNNKYGKKEFLQSLVITICVISILIFNMIGRNWHIIILIPLVILFIYLITKSKEEKKQKKQKDKELSFFFYEKHIKIKFKRQFERMNYFEIKKIHETDENFFLYTDENHSLILDKQGFTIGSSKEFAKFIKNKCPFKYKK